MPPKRKAKAKKPKEPLSGQSTLVYAPFRSHLGLLLLDVDSDFDFVCRDSFSLYVCLMVSVSD